MNTLDPSLLVARDRALVLAARELQPAAQDAWAVPAHRSFRLSRAAWPFRRLAPARAALVPRGAARSGS